MNHEKCEGHVGLMLGFKIAGLALKAGAVCAAFLIMKEIHKCHKAIEKKEK